MAIIFKQDAFALLASIAAIFALILLWFFT